MLAAVLERLPGSKLTLCEVNPPGVQDNELLLEVDSCGICGTDLHILEGVSYRPELPFVLGHEPVGRVVGAGSAARSWIGRRVTLTLFEGCGTCAFCQRGDERLCPELRAIYGVQHAWGGFAERMAIPSALAVEVPDGLGSDEAATLVDAGATAMNAATVLRSIRPKGVLVLGGGPVGFLTAEIMAAASLEVTLAERLPGRRAVLAERGHRVVADAAELDPGFGAVVECTGSPDAVTAGLRLLAAQGMFLVVGYTTLPRFDFAPIARRELRVQGVRSGSRAHLEEVLKLAAAGEIGLPPISRWNLSEVNEALSALRAGVVPGKVVVHIN